MVVAFPQDISAFLSFPCSSKVYLHRWNFLEGYISQGEVDLRDIYQVRGVQPSRTSAYQHFSALPSIMGPFPMLSPPRTRYGALSPIQKLKFWPPTIIIINKHLIDLDSCSIVFNSIFHLFMHIML